MRWLRKNLANGGGSDPMAQASQLALDPGVAPRPIIAGQPEDQLDEFLADRRASRRAKLSPLGFN